MGEGQGLSFGPHTSTTTTIITIIIVVVIINIISFKFPNTEITTTHVIILQIRHFRWREEWLPWGDMSMGGKAEVS